MKFKKTIFLLFASLVAWAASGQQTADIHISISVSNELKAKVRSEGRLFVFLSEDAEGEPRTQLWPMGVKKNHIFAKNLKWDPAKPLEADAGTGMMTTAPFNLGQVPSGTYRLQVLWDQDTQESGLNAPGNVFSEPRNVEITKGQKLEIRLTEVIPPRQLVDDPLVKLVDFTSDTLSKWWKKPVKVKASVLLPAGFYDHPGAKYPVRYNVAGYGGRYTRVNYLVERDPDFFRWWTSDEAPRIINVFLDGEGPFGDSYQLDSDNSGPYGYALTHELIPYIEKQYRGIGTPQSRFVDGCSTGGWVSLALQLYYPDFFNGTWSYSPDAIDFENYQLIDIYKDDNAFYNEWGNQHPVARDLTGDPIVNMKDFIRYENVQGSSDTYLNSGGQFSAHAALYSPKGENGLPKPLFDPQTGKIDHQVAEYWKKYDLKLYLKENWAELGPKLQGKIWIWMGDMDHFYLNPATRAFDEFLKTTENPKSDAYIHFDAMQGHCQQYSHMEVLKMMGAKVKAQAKQ